MRPGIQAYDSGTLAELSAADVRFVDGTFFTAKELLALRPGAADAHAMGHLPMGGPGGSLEIVSELPGRTFYIHMNNTNPMLDAGVRGGARGARARCRDRLGRPGDRAVSGDAPLSADDFAAALRAVGEERYHHRHPFNVRMHEGRLSRRRSRPGWPTATTTRPASRSRTA